jgi:uncharacterized protein YndB with AHSA1/START domain
MPLRKDPSGQRSVEAEVEVPGTPEEVWAAIATGHGMSSWFVPSTSEERVGGIATNNFGPGMESIATIKQWNPPSSFVAETEEEPPGRVATEWTVEARGGGTCVVRVVHRWFASTDEWDDQFEGHTYGWLAFFRILKLYLTYFRGQQCSAFQLAIVSSRPMIEVWRSVMSLLAIPDDRPNVLPAPAAPVLAGRVEKRGDDAHPEVLLRLDQPAPGIAHLFATPMGPQTYVSIRLYLYGEQGADAVAESEPEWTSWVAERFPRDASC